MIVGIDEVGRGALAGPLCIAAVGLGEANIAGLTDSKKLTAKKREVFNIEIKQKALCVGIGWVSAKEIDRIGMSQALKLAARRAFAQVDNSEVSQIIIDGTIMLIDDPRATTMKQADLLVPSVSAASIIAKVTRDSYMQAVDSVFPGYGFDRNVGYGTSQHLDCISRIGPSPLHRMTFAPMSTTAASPDNLKKQASGSLAETVMAAQLKSSGYEILERNWKTRWCEIDLIAQKDNTIHFVEVKYRRSDTQGDGLEAITPRKLRQMTFAAELWLAHHQDRYDAVLSVASLSGDTFRVDDFFDLTTT